MTTSGNIDSEGFEYEVARIKPPENHFLNVLILAKAAKKKREVEKIMRERYGKGKQYIPPSRKRALSSLIATSYTPRCDR